ncbi:MAG: alkaline phosphatase [Rhodospirillales bacterium]|nr:MAG: alkaline phosphatase [Rhodospirillales bacterium]
MHVKTIASALVLSGFVSGSLVMPAPANAHDHLPPIAKNVILMVTDGASWGTWDMASYWEYGELGQQPYDSFPVKLGMTTYPLNNSNTPTGTGIPQISYEWSKAWDITPVDTVDYRGNPNYFAGYEYIKVDWTDSAAAGTALATGHKSYNSAINFDDFGNPLRTIVHHAKELGRSTGSISSVPFSHATPAALGGAQNLRRNAYHEITNQMLSEGHLDVLMGGGHPWYNDNGELRGAPNYFWISEADWTAVESGATDWTLVTSKEDFEKIASSVDVPTGRVFGVPEVAATLQYNRSRDPAVLGADPSVPSGVAYLDTVPTLATMTRAALNILGQNPDGMYLHIEGGAVDWAAHANDTARIIEEQVDFNHSVKAVVDWVEMYSNWDETLLLVVTDHGNAIPMGPNSDTIPFEPVENRGQGELPGVKWHSGTHTNENTLMFAKGAGSYLLYNHIVGWDPGLRFILDFNDGRYIDNTAIYFVMERALEPVPLPASVIFLGSGLVALFAVARRRMTKLAA